MLTGSCSRTCTARRLFSAGNRATSLHTLSGNDFGAAGINGCCSKGGGPYGGQFRNQNAHGGLRLMRKDLCILFRLADQQAMDSKEKGLIHTDLHLAGFQSHDDFRQFRHILNILSISGFLDCLLQMFENYRRQRLL